MTDRKFYRTVIEVEVLSEAPFFYDDLNDVHEAITGGECSGQWKSTVDNEEVDEAAMAKLLVAQGSDPGFFRIALTETTTITVVAFQHKTPGEGVGGFEWDVNADKARQRVAAALEGDPNYETFELTREVELLADPLPAEVRDRITAYLDRTIWSSIP